MTADWIMSCVRDLRQKYREGDPFRLARSMGILVLEEPMGTGDSCCKGFFFVQSRIPAIVVNADLPLLLQRIIVMHEIGHAVLHRKKVGSACFHDYELFDAASLTEYEANIFAAEYLLEDDAVLEALNADLSFFQAAALLQVPPELLSFKFRMMKQKGSLVIDSPILADSKFLKKVPAPEAFPEE